ncbi:MAG: hypothetical protein WCB92_05840, partial [Mycobacterium sp.]
MQLTYCAKPPAWKSALAGTSPGFDTADVPADPVSLFAKWLQQAADAGVQEPHAMTLSTVDA